MTITFRTLAYLMATGVGLRPGPELDALVAEHVFGEPIPTVAIGDVDVLSRMLAGGETRSAGGNWLAVCRYSDGDVPRWVPRRYSTDIPEAWRVVEEVGLSVVRSEDGWYAIKPADIEHGSVRGTDHPRLSLVGEEGERWTAAATAPEAICRAALKVVADTPRNVPSTKADA